MFDSSDIAAKAREALEFGHNAIADNVRSREAPTEYLQIIVALTDSVASLLAALETAETERDHARNTIRETAKFTIREASMANVSAEQYLETGDDAAYDVECARSQSFIAATRALGGVS